MIDIIKRGDAVYTGDWWGTAVNGSPGDIAVVLELPGEENCRYVAPAESVLLVVRAGKVVATRCQGCKCLYAHDLTGDGWLCDYCHRRLDGIVETMPGRKHQKKASEAHASEDDDRRD